MSCIHPDTPVSQGSQTPDQSKIKHNPSFNWVKDRLSALDRGSSYNREAMMDRIDGILSHISNRSLSELFLRIHPR